MFIVISGNIGSGKTTLSKKLSEFLGWECYLEPVQQNPYLADFYKDMPRWSFPLQIYFLSHRFHTHRNIEESTNSGIQDRSIYEDAYVFARALFEQGDMSERDYENYLMLFHSMIEFLSVPSLVIYLDRSLPNLQERIRMRGREFERTISLDYLTRLNHYYLEWFHNYTLGPSLKVDTNDLDLLHNQTHFLDLVEKIKNIITKQQIRSPGNQKNLERPTLSYP
ncbi:MAG: deoxynucleoside kinase [Oligoflexia bacterium]|nr:deoxynucleoside kinase [Oligoflexia bacterium]